MKNKGITLVALVITIIVLIILASVTFSIVLGQDGLIGKTKDGGEAYKKAAVNEQQQLDNINDVIDSILSGNGNSNPVVQNPVVTLAEAQSDDMYDKTINSKYTDTTRETNNVVTIPAGYKMTDDASKIEDGIVIRDRAGNQWVWIPVDEAMADTITATELGGTGKSGVTTTLKSKSELVSGITRSITGNTNFGSYREPCLATDYDRTSNAGTYLAQAGFTNAETALTDFATELSTSYKNMIESVAYYGGFYVGRYEITGTIENPTEVSGWPITGGTGTEGRQEANWYKLYLACTKFTTTSATSKMIWSCQWDEVCKFIANKGYTDSNSGSFGNYENELVSDSNGTTIKAGWTAKRFQTGATTYTRTCNIYDLAGNCDEWNQEVNDECYRSYRGGSYTNGSSGNCPVSYRTAERPNTTDWGTISSRPVLYINK